MNSKLQFRAETYKDDEGNSYEVGTVLHEGKEFSAGGAMVTPTHIIAYPNIPGDKPYQWGELTDWQGKAIGKCRIVAKWKTCSVWGSHMYQIEAVVNDVTYTGRSFGSGMAYKGKAKKAA